MSQIQSPETGVLQRLKSLEHVAKEIGAWFDPASVDLYLEGLKWLSETFIFNYPNDIPQPFVYPSTEGKVQFEWSFSSYEITLEINPKLHTASWCCYNIKTKEEDILEPLNLDAKEDWLWIINEIKLKVK